MYEAPLTLQIGMLLFTLGIAADLVTTIKALNVGLSEANPIAGKRGERLWLLWLLNVVILATLLSVRSLAADMVGILLGAYGVVRMFVARRNWGLMKGRR